MLRFFDLALASGPVVVSTVVVEYVAVALRLVNALKLMAVVDTGAGLRVVLAELKSRWKHIALPGDGFALQVEERETDRVAQSR